MILRAGLVALVAALASVGAQQCDTVYSTLVHCLSDGPLTLTCPDKHWLLVQETSYFVGEGDTCPPPDGARTCTAPGDVTEVSTCHQATSECSVSVVERTSSACPGSHHYVWVQYQCEPLHNTNGNAYALAMCSSQADSFTGSLVHIDSHPTGLFGTWVRNRNDCNCGITIPAGNEVFLRAPFFLKRATTGPLSGTCSQNLLVWNETSVVSEFCEQGASYNMSCSDRERTLYVRYNTDSNNVKVIFLLQIFVPYLSSGLTITCGIPDAALPFLPPGISNATDIPYTTPEPGPFVPDGPDDPDSGSDDNMTEDDSDATSSGADTNDVSDAAAVNSAGETNWKLPIILGMVGLSILIMVIVVLVIIIRIRRNQEKDDVSETTSDRRSNMAFITDIYVEGNQKSKLVLDKKQGLLKL